MKAPPGNQDASEQLDLVRRIAASDPFKKSPRLRELLVFITKRTLARPDEPVIEREIGCGVFTRPSDYDPIEDSIVRTAARQLRLKLREYFEGQGSEEPWLLEIPKGGYAPVFTRRQIPAAFQPSLASMLVEVSDQPVRIVASDTALLLMSNMVGRTFSHEEYDHRSFSAASSELLGNERMADFCAGLACSRFTSFADLAMVSAIHRACAVHADRIIVRHSRDISARDLHTGNAILIGGLLSNPWTMLFEKNCNFRVRVHFQPDRLEPKVEFENRKPLKGEPARFGTKVRNTASRRLSFARVAFLPNLSGDGRILLLTGLNAVASEAAGEFAADPAAAAEVMDLFKSKHLRTLPSFEIMLETSTVDDVPRRRRIVAFRKIEDQKWGLN